MHIFAYMKWFELLGKGGGKWERLRKVLHHGFRWWVSEFDKELNINCIKVTNYEANRKEFWQTSTATDRKKQHAITLNCSQRQIKIDRDVVVFSLFKMQRRNETKLFHSLSNVFSCCCWCCFLLLAHYMTNNSNNKKKNVVRERSRKHYQTRPRFYHFVENNSHIWHWSSTSSSRDWHNSKRVYVCVCIGDSMRLVFMCSLMLHIDIWHHTRVISFSFSNECRGILHENIYPKYWWCCKSKLNSYIYKDNVAKL